ncbi:hypothetical protein Tco_0814679 [Tanacetum coccineum]
MSPVLRRGRQCDPDMLGGIRYAKELGTLLLVFQKLYKPTNNNLRTSLKLRNRLKIPHKEKMMMCKQAEQGVPLQAERADWLEDTDEEIDEQELEAHYSTKTIWDEKYVFANNVRRHSEQLESINDTYVLEKDDSNVIPDSSNICTNDNQVDQNATECVDERAALANLIANLTLEYGWKNKTGRLLAVGDSCLIALQTKLTELEKVQGLMTDTSGL